MSDPTSSKPSWIHVGNTVALEETNRQIEYVTIERLTDTLIIAGGGRRFRRGGYFPELPSDNGSGVKTNRQGRLADPESPAIVRAYAQQQLRRVALEAGRAVDGSGATVHTLDPVQVRDELDRIARVVDAARKEIDRRAHL